MNIKRVISIIAVFFTIFRFNVFSQENKNVIIMMVNSPVYFLNGNAYEYSDYPVIKDGEMQVCVNFIRNILFSENNCDFSEYRFVESVRNFGADVSYSLENGIIIIGNSDISPDIYSFGIYVSQLGDDENNGTAYKPVKTVEKALQLYSASCLPGTQYGHTVFIREGTYRQAKTLNLNSLHNGIIVRNYPDEEVVISGGIRLDKSSFQLSESESGFSEEALGKVYETDLSSILNTVENYREYTPMTSSTSYYCLYTGDKSHTLARYPNEGWLTVGNVSEDGKTFLFEDKRANNWGNSSTAMVFGYWSSNYSCQPLYINSVNSTENTITLKNAPQGALKAQRRYYAFNMLEELDCAGEWYINPDTLTLYYYPHEADWEYVDLNASKSDVIKIDGAENITLDGITVEGSRACNIRGTDIKNVTLKNSVIRNSGNTGVYLKGDNITVESCTAYNIGGTAIAIETGNIYTLETGNSVVKNCRIYDFSQIFRTYTQAVRISGVGTTVNNNTIYDAPHMAMRYWGCENIIVNNEIYNVCNETSDSGAIYASNSWRYGGNIIKNNYFHDILSTLGGNGIYGVYLDNLMSGTAVEENIFENCSTGFIGGGGRANSITDNIFKNCDRNIVYDARGKSGNWLDESAAAGGTSYTDFYNFLYGGEYDCEKYKEKYAWISELAEEVETYIADNDAIDLGIPKNVLISGNRCFCDESEFKITASELTETDNNTCIESALYSEDSQVINVKRSGSSVSDAFMYVKAPLDSAVVNSRIVNFMWNDVVNADSYSFTLYDSDGKVVYSCELDKTEISVSDLKHGNYSWTVKAYYKGSLLKNVEASFTVSENACDEDKMFLYETFENYDTGDFLPSDNWKIKSLAEGDKAEIITEQGNKLLQITRAEKNLLSSVPLEMLLYTDSTVGNGIVKISYDIKFVNNRGAIYNLFSAGTDDGRFVSVNSVNGDSVYFGGRSGAANERVTYFGTAKDSEKHYRVTRKINYDSKEVSVFVTNLVTGESVLSKTIELNTPGGSGVYPEIQTLILQMRYVSGQANVNSGTTDAVIQIDNIKVERDGLYVYNIRQEGKKVLFYFTGEPDSASILDGITVYKDGDIAESAFYNAEFSQNVLSVTVDSTENVRAVISDDYGYTFKPENYFALKNIFFTNESGAEIYNIADYCGKSIYLNAEADAQIEDYFVLSEIGDTKTKSIKLSNGSYGRTVKIKLNIPEEVTEETKVNVFFWEKNMKPISKKIEVYRGKNYEN